MRTPPTRNSSVEAWGMRSGLFMQSSLLRETIACIVRLRMQYFSHNHCHQPE